MAKPTPSDPGWYMLWRTGSGISPFEYFNGKYGYMPTMIGIGEGVEIEIPKGVYQVEKLMVPDKHIKLR